MRRTAVWDGEYCVEPGCGERALCERWVGMCDDNLMVELVCPQHDPAMKPIISPTGRFLGYIQPHPAMTPRDPSPPGGSSL